MTLHNPPKENYVLEFSVVFTINLKKKKFIFYLFAALKDACFYLKLDINW